MSAVDVLATTLREVCGHDSRSVDGCPICEAADLLEQRDADVAELIEAAGKARDAMMLRDWHVAGDADNPNGKRKAFDNLRAALARVGGGK